MTKSDLIKALQAYPDDKHIYITLKGAKQVFPIETVNYATPYSKSPCLEADEAPSFDDIEGMAWECFKQYKESLLPWQVDALVEVCDAISKERNK